MTTLTRAHHEWANRASDERFASLEDLHAAATGTREIAGHATVSGSSLSVREIDGDVVLDGGSAQATLTNWSFRQLASAAKAPVDYITKLPARLAADCLNEGLKAERQDDKLQLLFSQKDEGLELRAMTSDKYARIWNSDITERLLDLQSGGTWQPAPAAFDGSRGLYMGDRDMFAFMVDNERRIFETLPEGGLSRGFFIWNSEVGARSFGIMTFLYEYVCGNHRVWGAQDISELRIAHIGNAGNLAFDEIQGQLVKYAEGAATEDELVIQRMIDFKLGKNRNEVLDAILQIRGQSFSKKFLDKTLDLAESREDWYGNPYTAWGVAGAMTEIARDLPNADERHSLEKASVKVQELALIG